MKEEEVKKTPEEIAAEEARQEVIDKRTEAFVAVFDFAEENDIHFDSPTWKAVSLSATTEKGIRTAHTTEDLSNLKVEPELMSVYEFNRILKRARSAIKSAVAQRKQFVPILKDGHPTGEVAGPYFTSRKQKRALKKRIFKTVRQAQRSIVASTIVQIAKSRSINGVDFTNRHAL